MLLTASDPARKMGGIVPRRLLVILGALALAGPTAAAGSSSPPAALQLRLARALRVPHVSPARSGALAVDLSSGAVVYTQNGFRSFAPASNEKLTVTYAALALLGPTYRFETDVFGQGWEDGSVWRGALVLRGAGDPTLTHFGLR
jgi:D-alanyl-D-alanine carboxypeptidase/D-alanyl-D-alanine-endopeptidase (penicillin-binding protein 4)